MFKGKWLNYLKPLLWVALALVILSRAPASRGSTGITRGVTKERLENGLTVVVKEDHSAPVASIQIWVRAGSSNETEEEAGITHFIEHMIFKGTKKRGPGEIARAIEAAGGSINAYTSYDRTVYYVEVPAEATLLGLDVLLDAVQNAVFDPEEIEREKEVVLEELRRSLDSPWRRLSREQMWLCYQGHPYGRPIIGYEATIKRFSRSMIQAYMDKWYLPQNMVLVAVGDLDASEFLEQARKLSLNFPERKGVEDAQRIPASQSFTRRLVLPDKVEQVYMELAWHIPAAGHQDIAALDILEVLLGEGKTSRLYKKLKMERNLVHTFSVSSSAMLRSGLFSISATLAPAKIEPTLEAISQALGQLVAQGPKDAELRKAISQVETSFLWGMEKMEGQARVLGHFEVVEGDFRRCDSYIEQVRSVTGQRIKEVAGKYLTPGNLTAAFMVPLETGPLPSRDELAFILSGGEKRAKKPPLPHVSRAAQESSKARMVVLSNGIRVIMMEDRRLPIVAFTMAILGGTRLEEPGKWGISEFVSRLLTRGTTTRSASQIALEVESVAGELNGFSGRNSFGLSGAFLAKDLELALKLLSDCLLNPSFSQDQVEKVRDDILSQIRAKKDKPMALLFDLFYSTLYRKHPYGRPLLGTQETISALRRENLVAWYRNRATGPNCVLALVGDFDSKALVPRLKDLFEKLSAGGEGLEYLDPEPPIEAPRIVHQKRAGAQTHLVLGYLGERLSSPYNASMALVDAALSGQGGRLFVRLRDQMSLAYSVSSFRRPGLETGVFGVYLGCAPRKVAKARKALLQEMKKLAQQGLTKKELSSAKKYLLGNLAIGSQGRASKALQMALDELYGLGFDYSEKYKNRLKSVSLPMIKKAIARVVLPERYVFVTLGP